MVEILSDGFRVASLLFIMVLLIFIIRFEQRRDGKAIMIMFLASLSGYLLAYWQPITSVSFLREIFFFMAVSLPYFFWLLSRILFNDSFKFNRSVYVLTIAMPVISNGLYKVNAYFYGEIYYIFKALPYLLSALFICLSMYEALRGHRSDLINIRLRWRYIFITSSALMALTTLYFFFFNHPLVLPQMFVLIQNIGISVFLALFFTGKLQWNTIFSNPQIKKETEPSSDNSEIIVKINEVFVNMELYKKEGITITELAGVTGFKEYLVRRAINGEMGFTNFVSFLNYYRIKEACKIIDNDKGKDITFQEISFGLGYKSVATFNRAFKKETDKTPSEYRNSK
ncbi:MAG: AraC family transcriptional regulator [Bacteroidales bacterium]|jgi:AraC-like DNA-binding protein|nr:AraC family transcriptional regulator [Bacteroidales bacterium]